eukprot:scaffold22893_cov27-Tisochrysis_lutea.AAC.2
MATWTAATMGRWQQSEVDAHGHWCAHRPRTRALTWSSTCPVERTATTWGTPARTKALAAGWE